MSEHHIVVMTGTSEVDNGGITAVIRLMKKMPIWGLYNVYWLATQTKETGKLCKLWTTLKASLKAPFVLWNCKIVHFHIVPGITLLEQLPVLFFAKIQRKKVIMEVHVGNQLVNYANNRFFKWWLRRADLILLLAKRWEQLFKELYTDVTVSTDVLYNACEFKKYIPMREKKKMILFCGTIHDNKAPDLLINAWSKLKNKHPDWHLAFLGSGEIARYKQLAENMEIGDCVEFTGFLTGNTKEQYFHDASIYCMCSYMEGFPMVVLEAWSNSIAVITTPVGGLPDVIEDGNNCLVFPMGDSDTLAEQIERLIDDESLLSKIALNGHEYANEHFSIETINNKIDAIYSSII